MSHFVLGKRNSLLWFDRNKRRELRFGLKWVFIFPFLSLFFTNMSHAKGPLLVAAASDLRFAMEAMTEAFERTTGTTVKVSYGSSGSFFAQISSGAPFDLFLSADTAYPNRLVSDGFAGPVFVYGQGCLVLWVPNGSPVPIEADGMKALRHPSVRKIAIANPAHAPYGVAAVAVLKQEGLYDLLRPLFVLGDNVAQAAQFVQSGGADVGILACSLVKGSSLRTTGRYTLIPRQKYPSFAQGGVVLKKSRYPKLAGEFVDFILRGEGKEILKSYAFHEEIP